MTPTTVRALCLVLVLGLTAAPAATHAQDVVRLHAAGSLRGALTDILSSEGQNIRARFGFGADATGTMRRKGEN